MNKIREIWSRLPKSIKVFLYIAVSQILAEVYAEFSGMDQTLLIRVIGILINLIIVALEDAIKGTEILIRKIRN